MLLKRFIQQIRNWFRCPFLYIIADAADNSITFSRQLFKHLDVMKLDVARVYVFYIPQTKCYGFMLNPPIAQETQLADVQYNSRHKCIGFECLCPTVNRIFYDYGLQASLRCKLSVKASRMPDGRYYYQICRPYGKPAW